MTPTLSTPRASRQTGKGGRDLRFVIVGAGMSGILAAIRLQQEGLHDFVIYEKADRLGGTWRENTYPGISCDVPAHLYSYSFAPNPDWSHRFAPGAEIQAYFERVARQYGVDRRIRYGKEAVFCEFREGRWHVEFGDGTHDVGDCLVAATGVLHHPAYPDFEGLDSFRGAAFHSARWRHDVELRGRRVGVVGTGSSAVQIVPAIVDRVRELVLFQRTPQWIMPVENPPYSEEEKEEFRRNPARIREIREEVSRMFTEGFSNHLSDVDSPQLRWIHDTCVANLENNVKDPVLREKLRPNYRAGCKRLVMSPNFYEAIQKPNARLVTEKIVRVEPAGVRTEDGKLHELDVLVLATGFRVDAFVRPTEVLGRGGKRLDDVWNGAPFAYMSLAVPDFPNLFFLNGPNSPVGNFSLIEVAELQFDSVLRLIGPLRSGVAREIAPSWEATERFDRERREAAKRTIWASGCRSWYLDSSGLPTAWPWTFDRFREEMKHPRLGDYELR
ncbi:MAG: putative monooxygenase [Candidatus Binatia bacterium]|nr:MAG: putative monooxygenase [Candidatus Binatia bacterium]